MVRNSEDLLSIYLRYQSTIASYLARQTGSRESGEDLAQEAWIRLMRNSEAATAAPAPYLFRTVRNLLIDHFRKSRRTLGAAQIADVLSVADEGPDPARQAEDRDQLGALALILGELPDRQREVLISARLRRERHAIIAARYGVTTRTIEMEIRRALDHCARRLDEMNGH